MSEDLIAFVKARLDEDEAAAVAAQSDLPFTSIEYRTAPGSAFQGRGITGYHAQRNPPRALREVAALRKIVGRFTEAPDWTGGEDVRYLAAIWSDRPDYRPEWKP